MPQLSFQILPTHPLSNFPYLSEAIAHAWLNLRSVLPSATIFLSFSISHNLSEAPLPFIIYMYNVTPLDPSF